MPKPPILEILRFSATPRMLRWLLVVLFAILIPTVGTSLAREFFPRLAVHTRVVPLEVPELGWTTEGPRGTMQVRSGIPDKPGPNQKRAGSCDPQRSEVEINGGCWVKTEHPLPCPIGVQWEHEGRCWLPVAPAAQLPSSGGSFPVNIADP
jgi:hypothetical protein